MASINLNCRVWADRGTKGKIQDHSYEAGVQPIAEYDNYTNWAITQDLHNLNDELGNLENTYVNEEGDTMKGDLNMDVYCLEYDSGWGVCNANNGVKIENSDKGIEFLYTEDGNGNAVEEIDGYTSWHAGNFDPSDYWTKPQAEDRYLNVDGSDHMEASLDVGGHRIVDVDDSIEFTSKGGTGLDFRPNSDGTHYLFRHNDGGSDAVEFAGQLRPSSGQILELERAGSYRHRFGNDGDYRNTGSIHSEGQIRSDSLVDVRRDQYGGDGWRLSAAEGRPYIAPTPNGNAKWGDELYWESGEWTFETSLNVRGDVQLSDNDVRGIESLFFSEGTDVDAGIHYQGGRQTFNIEDTGNNDRPIHFSSGPIHMERSLDVGTVQNLETLQFKSSSGTAIDLSNNADGNHVLWKHADNNNNTSNAQLGTGNGYLQQWAYNNNRKHEFRNDGTYENWGGAVFRGGVELHDNNLTGIETIGYTDGWATATFDGQYRLKNRAENSIAYSYDNDHTFHNGQVQFNGGSVYWGNTAGNNPNDSYDAVWENQPSGKDFRIHMKRDPELSNLSGDVGMLFSTNGNHNGPIIGCDVDTGITYVEEIRSARNEQSGTPVAEGDLAAETDIGEIWYDRDANEFRGKLKGGEVVAFGDPI